MKQLLRHFLNLVYLSNPGANYISTCTNVIITVTYMLLLPWIMAGATFIFGQNNIYLLLALCLLGIIVAIYSRTPVKSFLSKIDIKLMSRYGKTKATLGLASAILVYAIFYTFYIHLAGLLLGDLPSDTTNLNIVN